MGETDCGGELGLVLMHGAVLSKSLIQFSVDGRGCVPSLLFDPRPNCGGGNEDNGDLFKRSRAYTAILSAPDPVADHRQPMPSPETPGHSQASLSQSLVGSLLLSFHAQMGSIKDRNGMDLTEAEDIKKKWQEYTEELYKKDLHDPDNHNGVITHLEPDILEGKVKWALGSITMNKASGGDGIPVELFQILKDDAVKVLHSICQQIWKT